DFGIAKNLNLKTQVTFNEDSIIGTPAYLSPEQIRNDPVSFQTDIYSFGLMLYELVTGRQPFEGQGMGIIASHLEKEVPSVLDTEPDAPPALDTIIRRASAKNAADRYASITDMVGELREAFAPAIVPILPYESQPRYKDPNRHVFITYSPGDTEFIQRLTYDLDSEGVPVWADKQHLKPGTRGWEDSRREAIRSAYAVILVASPETRRSDYVQDELAIADMYNCPVYPVWAAGDNWSAILPPGVDTGERIDARGDQYSQALLELVMLLGTYTPESDTEEITVYGLTPAETFVPRNPYKVLRAFREDDQADFFGRDGLVNLLLETLNGLLQPGESRLLAVVGPSGSGKSSVVMAGLLPALRGGSLPESERWTVLPPFVPGATPLENLTIALASVLPNRSAQAIEEDLRNPSARGLHLLARQAVDRQNSRLVLYVDQFEELFTQTGDEAERQQFINLLLTAVSEPGGPVVALLTLRADFYDRPMNYPELGRLIERNSKAVLPLSLAELYSVIQKPALLPDVALQFDSGLVADLVFEVRGQPGGLPLLQFTLDQLFDRRSGQRLTNAAYEEIGGVCGALAKHTEATYQNLPSDEHRHMVRGLFLRLIEPGATEQDTTRRRAPRSELVLADARQNR
ncbi:MAG: TIR domain-containing protein, partial [Anaerolineae bacterium]|nr:TIR domain-containing protein [Anaerolineae bacterium]